LIYSGPKTVGEAQAREPRCVVDSTGKHYIGWKGTIQDIEHLNLSTEHPAPGMPDPKTCVRGAVWKYLP
jgi:hypothetical protein